MKFSYRAFDALNREQKGVLDASSLREATEILISKGWFVKKISPRGKVKENILELNFGRVALVDKVLFIKHLSTMIKSGINLHEALEVIAEQTASKKFSSVIKDVLAKVRSGQSLGGSLAKYPKVFDPLFVNIIKVGESSGTLEENLDYLGNELESRLELRRTIKAASFYPAIILFATFGLGLVLSYFVLPKISKLFVSLNFELPLSTRILLWAADLMDKHGGLIVLSLLGTLIALRILVAQKFAKPYWHRLLIALPVIGHLVINYNMVLITRTLSILLKSGLTIDRSLEVAITTTNNYVYRKLLNNVLPEVRKGKKMSDVISMLNQSKRKPLISLLAIKMIGVGERSGRMDESLNYLANYYEKEVANATKNMTTVLEPALLLTVGLIVGFVAVSVITPIYQVTSQFQR
ncbi:MAG: type II secretion system F family protein [Candidatus Buchananbacteria bacterium]|nr:type II secretion system F family protein [Candidatus Buchananbacteria bacterium]